MDGYTLLWAAAAGSTAALVALRALAGDDDRRLVRRIARTPRLSVAAFDDTCVGTIARVVGTVRALDGGLATSLVDGVAALALDVEVALAVGGSRTPLGRAVRAVPFLVDDGAGALLVRAAAARLAITSTVERVLPRPSLTDPQRAVVEAVEADSPLGSRTTAVAWGEARLLPGARVAVVGRVARLTADPSEGHAYRDRAARAALVDAPGAPLLITDDPAALD